VRDLSSICTTFITTIARYFTQVTYYIK